MRYSTLSDQEKWIIKGIPIIFIIGSFLHFLYHLSNDNMIVALIAAVNESVWEHMKLMVWPLILWWICYYFATRNKTQINWERWFAGALISLVTALATIPLLYYFYTEAFGLELLAVDIFIFFLAVLIGQLMGLHLYKYSKGLSPIVSLGLILAITLSFMIFTFSPPKLPLLMDSSTGQYGLQKPL